MSAKKAKKAKVNRNQPPPAVAPPTKGPRGPLYRGNVDTPLLRAMVRAGLTARDVANVLGCSEWSVCRWLDGLRPIPHYRACLRKLLGAEAMPE